MSSVDGVRGISTIASSNGSAYQDAFFENGYIIVRNAVSTQLLEFINDKIRSLLNGVEPAHRRMFPRQGSMIPASLLDAAWSSLIADSSILQAMRYVGARDLRWLSGFLISKPPGSPRLWWHQDWWAWQDPISCADLPAQLSVMVYPEGAIKHNGCLRVIPGSHRKRHPLHDVLPEAHSNEANRLPDDHPAYQTQPDEVSLEVGPNDIVLCDARLLHSTHTNSGDRERPGITLWYLPDYESLPSQFQQHYGQHLCQPNSAERLTLAKALQRLAVPLSCSDAGLSSIDLVRTPGRLLQD